MKALKAGSSFIRQVRKKKSTFFPPKTLMCKNTFLNLGVSVKVLIHPGGLDLKFSHSVFLET